MYMCKVALYFSKTGAHSLNCTAHTEIIHSFVVCLCVDLSCECSKLS